MPLVRISLRSGKSPAYKRAVCAGIYEALRATFDVPDEDRFMLIHEHEKADFAYSPTYLGITRGDDLVIIQITVSNTRGVEQKKALYAAIVDRLATDPGMARGDVLINIIEVTKENWSFGDGRAQYV